jgi:hypothetical protein
MERFSDEIKKDFPQHNTPSDIQAELDTLIRLKLPEIDGYALSPVSTAPATVSWLLQSGLRRTIELTEAAIREMNRKNLVASALLARGTLETSCLLWDVVIQIKAVVEKDDTAPLNPLFDVINRSLFGGNAKDVMIDEEIRARRIGKVIQGLSSELSVPLDGFYARLSEYAHPNYHGMMATYTDPGFKGTVKTFCDRRPSSEQALISTALGTVATSCSIVVDSFKKFAAAIERFTVLSEREIYEKGEWPPDTDYPVRRV